MLPTITPTNIVEDTICRGAARLAARVGSRNPIVTASKM